MASMANWPTSPWLLQSRTVHWKPLGHQDLELATADLDYRPKSFEHSLFARGVIMLASSAPHCMGCQPRQYQDMRNNIQTALLGRFSRNFPYRFEHVPTAL